MEEDLNLYRISGEGVLLISSTRGTFLEQPISNFMVINNFGHHVSNMQTIIVGHNWITSKSVTRNIESLMNKCLTIFCKWSL